MKLVLFAILGLLLGVGGGAAMSVMTAKKGFAAYDAKRARVVADSIEQAAQHLAGADSSAASDSSHAVPADSLTRPTEVAGAGGSHPAAPEPTVKQDAAPGGSRQRAVATVESHGGTLATGKPSLPRPLPATTAPSSGTDKIGKIFAAMPPKDAAKVLEQLADADVHDILKSLSDKQAAGIMQFLPTARAAAISKLALKGGHE